MIALIADDSKKHELVNFIQTHLEYFWNAQVISCSETATLLKQHLNLHVESAGPRASGGMAMIAERVAQGTIGGVIYLRDPAATPTTPPEISAVLQACDLQGIPSATNLATAEAIVAWMQQAQHRCR